MERADVVIVGAGVFGLCAALAIARRGRRVLVLDRAAPGAGASGGVVGALAPFAPAPWSAKKAFQHDALLAAEAFWRGVAAASGVDPGYGRIGRILPLRMPGERGLAEARAASAAAHWRGARWAVQAPDRSGLLAPQACAAGVVHEKLTARLAPRAALRALTGALTAAGGSVRQGSVAEVRPGRVLLADGDAVAAETIVIAAGHTSGALLAPFGGPAVSGVKGQAVLLAGPAPAAMPVVSEPGLWIVPHADDTVAVGSTSEPVWKKAGADSRADALVARARALCPWLRTAAVLERWAGIRPRGQSPDPIAGPVAPGVFVATGGFKLGFGLAPAVGALLAAMIAGEAVEPPPGVTLPQQGVL